MSFLRFCRLRSVPACVLIYRRVVVVGLACLRVDVGPFHQMIGALETVSRLCAIGLGLEEDALSTLMHEGPHLLAPTGERARYEACVNPSVVENRG